MIVGTKTTPIVVGYGLNEWSFEQVMFNLPTVSTMGTLLLPRIFYNHLYRDTIVSPAQYAKFGCIRVKEDDLDTNYQTIIDTERGAIAYIVYGGLSKRTGELLKLQDLLKQASMLLDKIIS